MTEPPGNDFPLTEAVASLLSDEALWANPPDGLSAAIRTRIPPSAPQRATGTDNRAVAWWTGALVVAAAVVLAVVLVVTGGTEPVAAALAGTDLAPGATATAEFHDTRNGVAIFLSVSSLPPAPPGTYYEGWVSGDRGTVAIGTFHMRGGDAEIELWSGVPVDGYPVITVTLQDEGTGAEPSGRVVLRGEIGS